MNKKNILLITSLIIIILTGIVIIFNSSKETITYDVSFETNGGTIINTQTIKEGEKVIKPENPTKKGYTFIEWTYQNKTYDFNADVTTDMSLIARWEKEEEPLVTFIVEFDSVGGTIIEEQIIKQGDKVTKPANPEKDGYTFVYWMLDDQKYTFESEVKANITLQAKWEKVELKKYTIKFDSNGGSSINNQVVESGSKVNKPSNPTKKYYKFVEWQYNGKSYNFNNLVNSDLKLTAKWELSLPTTLPKPKVEVSGDQFDRIGLGNTINIQCQYDVKLTNYKDYMYLDENGEYSYFVDQYYIVTKEGVKRKINRNIEETTTLLVYCGEIYDFYIQVVRENNNNIEATSSSDIFTIDTKKDLTPTLKLGKWACGNGTFCSVQLVNGRYRYRLDVFESVGLTFDDGVIEIYEKENNEYKYIGDAGHESGLYVEIEPNTKKTYVARAYIANKLSEKVYGNYSNELIIDTSKEK